MATHDSSDNVETSANNKELYAPGPVLSHDEVETGKQTSPDETARVLDHAAETKLALKFDVRILPVLAVMC
jgi:hypothetical protein